MEIITWQHAYKGLSELGWGFTLPAMLRKDMAICSWSIQNLDMRNGNEHSYREQIRTVHLEWRIMVWIWKKEI